MQDQNTAGILIRDGLRSFIVLLFAFAAYDDITTDNATSFRLEYAMLALSAVWLGFVAVRLLRFGYRTLGIASLTVLAGAAWGLSAIGRGSSPGFWPGYVVTIAAFLWFLALVIGLLVHGVRARRSASG